MTQNEILDGLKEVIIAIRPKTDISAVNYDTKLIEELGIDSLSMMLLALATENKFNVRFENNVPFVTVGDVCNYIGSLVK